MVTNMYIFDTRERCNDHIKRYFERNRIEYRVAKVDTGDYMLEENPMVRVERKRTLGELCVNMCSKDVKRFYAEIRRAHDAGLKLVILCEHGGRIRTFQDVSTWKNQYGTVTGRMLQDKIYKLEMAYGVPVLFCDKRSTGRRIIEILTGKDTEDKDERNE